MFIVFNLLIIFIFLIYIINSYFLSIKENIIKFSSFLIRIVLAWFLAEGFAKKVVTINISNKNYIYNLNGKTIYTIIDLIKVVLIEKFPEFTYIIENRGIATYIIEGIAIMLIRIILVIIFYLLLTIIYKLIIYLIKRMNKTNSELSPLVSKQKGLAFGIIQGLLVIFLISIPFSGISLMTNDLLSLTEEETSLSKEIIFIKDYRKTITGRIFSPLKVKEKPIDIYFFDEVFEIRFLETKIHLTEEVRVYVEIIRLLEEGEIDLKDYNSLKGLNEKYLNELIYLLKRAESINISTPLLIDYFLLQEQEIYLSSSLYTVDYYQDFDILKELIIIYLNNLDINDISINNFSNLDSALISRILRNLGNLDCLGKLSSDITNILLNEEEVTTFLRNEELSLLDFKRVNYKNEFSLLSEIYDRVSEPDNVFTKNTVDEISSLILKSNLFKDNNLVILEYLILNNLLEYSQDIKRMEIDESDLRSFIVIAKVFIDNGYLEPYFRISKLYDEETINLLVESISSSKILRSNISIIFQLFLKKSNFDFDYLIEIPNNLDFESEEGKRELRDLLRLIQILNFGIDQKTLEEHQDEICEIVNNSEILRANLNNLLDWGIKKYNQTEYDIYIYELDFTAPEGIKEIKKLTELFKLLVNYKVLDFENTTILQITKEELDFVLSSKIIEAASIHLLCDLGKDRQNPLVVNFEVDSQDWYPSSRGDGELRYFLNAIRIIFKDVKSLLDIQFTPKLILSISDGTMDTNGDGVVDGRDENDLNEIMKSKILSDSIIKFLYDYYKEQMLN